MTQYSSDLTLEFWMRSTNSQQTSTLFMVQDNRGNTHLKATVESSSLTCYPNIYILGASTYAKLTLNFNNQWIHFTCIVNSSTSNTTLVLQNSSFYLSYGIHHGAIIAPATGIFNVFFIQTYQGYLREFRLWNKNLDSQTIQEYLFQTIDTNDNIVGASSLLLYFPFNSESEVTIFYSGLLNPNSPFAKLINPIDFLTIKFAACDSALIICPVSQVYNLDLCIFPIFNLTLTDVQTDYLVNLSSSVPLSSPIFSYEWQYPSITPSDSSVTNYLQSLINNISSNSFYIFKPALNAEYQATFIINILPKIYITFYGSITCIRTYTMSYNINCPSPSLSKTNIQLSNLNSTPISTYLTLSMCSVPYNIISIQWAVNDEPSQLQFFQVNSSSPNEITILTSHYQTYQINTSYMIVSTANVSMTSSTGETFYHKINAALSVIRHNYDMAFTNVGPSVVASYETLNLCTQFQILEDNVIYPNVSQLQYTFICPSAFPYSVCIGLSSGITLDPYTRMLYNAQAGDYQFGITGTWYSLTSTQTVIITILPPNPSIQFLNFSLYSDTVAYELVPKDNVTCDMDNMGYKWYFSDSQEILSASFQVKFEKKKINGTRKLIAEMSCNDTNELFYDYLQISNTIDTDLDVTASVQYPLTPLKDPLEIEISAR